MKSGAESPIQRVMITTQINNKPIVTRSLAFLMPSKLEISGEEVQIIQNINTQEEGMVYHFSRGCK